MRGFGKRGLAPMLLAIGISGGVHADPVDRVLLVTVDTLRADHLAIAGGPIPTPNFDRLASEGAWVDRAFTPTPSTAAAHASLMTGLYPWHHGVLRNATALDPRTPTLADAAKARGMATAAFVSSYILDKRFGLHQGFDTYVFEPTEGYDWRGQRREKFWTRGGATTRAAMGWITENAARPFFVWVHYFDPHTPYQPPPGFARPLTEPVKLDDKIVPEGVANREDLTGLIRAYRGEVAYTDAQLGHLVDRLALLGLLDRTLVVVTSDHGEGLGDHGLLQHGANLFDELVRVPLIVRGPGIVAGRRSGVAQLEDLATTLRAMTGAAPGADLDGVDLSAWLRGEVSASPRVAAVGRRRPYRNLPDLFYARTNETTWIGRADRPGSVFRPDSDPRELRPSPGNGMPESLRVELAAPAREERPVTPGADVRNALDALGYTDD